MVWGLLPDNLIIKQLGKNVKVSFCIGGEKHILNGLIIPSVDASMPPVV